MNIKNKLMKFFPRLTAEAHCDIPCGVYEPTPAKIAAKTVARMIQQLKEIKQPVDGDANSKLQYLNSVTRRIAVKEIHAENCKRELAILWSDFFKPEHLQKFPELHDLFWQAEKLCSKNKQEINEDAAAELIKIVDNIAEIFYQAKNAPEKLNAYREITDKLY